MGGNQGLFSAKLLSDTQIEKAVFQDLDEETVDLGYAAQKERNLNLSFAHYNFMASPPIVKMGYPPPYERYKSDIVFACALLHHLWLSQGFSLDHILQEISLHSKRYVCVEFMPKGLWTHQDGDRVSVPDWYNVDFFRDYFTRHFRLLVERKIGENQIVFLGGKK